jgi:hypothetical protein
VCNVGWGGPRCALVQVWLIDPFGSALFQYVKEGKLGTTGSSFIEGIGMDQCSPPPSPR